QTPVTRDGRAATARVGQDSLFLGNSMTDPSFGQQQPAPAGDYEVTLPPVAQLPETPGYATLVEPAALAERPKRSKKKLVLLSLLIVLLLGAAGAFTTLWMIERNYRQATAHELD